jgi:cephalosporin hydroxylase
MLGFRPHVAYFQPARECPKSAAQREAHQVAGTMNTPTGYEWRCDVPGETLLGIQRGTLMTRYRGLAFLKSPFDVVLYLQLLQQLRPGSVIEIGTYEGGSALWFADMMTTIGLAPCVISIDNGERATFDDSRIKFLRGDALRLDEVLSPDLLAALPRPFLVVEDSAHLYETSLAVLEFFDPHLHTGDYIIIEDGVIAFLPDPVYRSLNRGPNRALDTFLRVRQDSYAIDRSLCDFYGCNVTYNPNGWLRRL